MAKRLTPDEGHFVRYRNRKIYCLATSSYITLERIFERLEAGESIFILDRPTETDATGVILAREAVGHYMQKFKLNPTLEQVKELIALIKTWKSEPARSIRPLKRGANHNARNEGDEIKQEKKSDDKICNQIGKETQHDTMLPIGGGNCNGLGTHSFEPADNAVKQPASGDTAFAL
jgi:hypothetical protein